MFRRIIGCLILGALATGCAANATRMGVYATQNQDVGQQAKDTAECEQLAQTKAGSMGKEVAVNAALGIGAGAAVGAILGAVLGAFIGSPGELAAAGAAIGGVSWGLGGIADGARSNQHVFEANRAACLNARGYSVAR
jgi:hypothetical protein